MIIRVELHLNKPNADDFDVLSNNQTVPTAMAAMHQKRISKAVISIGNGTHAVGSLVLKSDGTWAYHSADHVLFSQNL